MTPRYFDLFPCRVAVGDNVLPQPVLSELAAGAYAVWDRLNKARRAFGREDRTPLEVIDPELFTKGSDAVKRAIESWYNCEVASIEGREVVFHDGDYITPHIEGGCDISAELFLDYSAVPDTSKSRYDGCLTLENPSGCWGHTTLPWEKHRVHTLEGITGRLVAHPAYMPHFVHPYYGPRPGINIHYEIRVKR